MNVELLHDLIECETDVDGALRRFCNNEALYISCLGEFVKDPTMGELEKSLKEQDWDEAFTAAHALKGLVGNMGFVPLFHASARLVVLIRAGRTKELEDSFAETKRCYQQVVSMICRHCGTDLKGE